MSVQFELNAESRADKGKGASRRLRRNADRVPAIVYGGGKDPVSISLEHREISHALDNEAFYSQIINLSVDGQSERVVLKDLQRHPAKPRILHADFQRVTAGQKLSVHVPVHFLNEESCTGVKNQGGVLSHHVSELEISCLPEHLPEYLEVDLAELALGGIVHLSEIPLPEGVELVALTHGDEHAHDQPVASVHKPRGVSTDETEEGEEGGEAEEKKED